jgi:pyruvate kinase
MPGGSLKPTKTPMKNTKMMRDVANTFLDETYCIMLSGEMASNGEHPITAIKIMSETCSEVESAVNFNSLYQTFHNFSLNIYGYLSTLESTASSIIKTEIDINVKGIYLCSESDTTTQQIAKFHSGCPFTVLATSVAYGVMKG